jgi:hypothetical protein
LAQSREVNVGLLVQPAPANNKFLAKIPDVRDRSTEAAYAELFAYFPTTVM